MVCEGREYRPPRYYDVLLEREDPEQMAEVKAKRLQTVERNKRESAVEEVRWLDRNERAMVARRDLFARRDKV